MTDVPLSVRPRDATLLPAAVNFNALHNGNGQRSVLQLWDAAQVHVSELLSFFEARQEQVAQQLLCWQARQSLLHYLARG